MSLHGLNKDESIYSLQANRLLELALHLERSVISLKMDALRLWNIGLAGTACGNLLSTIENDYGYPESRESKEQGLFFKTVEHEFSEILLMRSQPLGS